MAKFKDTLDAEFVYLEDLRDKVTARRQAVRRTAAPICSRH